MSVFYRWNLQHIEVMKLPLTLTNPGHRVNCAIT